MAPDHDLASAREAAAGGRLGEWVVEFLASPGSDNEPLAAAMAQRDLHWFGPVRVELAALTPMAGPAGPTVVVPVDEREWNADLEVMEAALEAGWEPPPMVVSHRDGCLFLEDGNHRHASLLAEGETHGWVVVCFETADERDAYARSGGRGDAPVS